MSESYEQLLTQFPLFSDFTPSGARLLLEKGEVKEHDGNAMIMREGDDPDFVILILTGTAEVFVDREGRELVLAECGPGSIIGEIGVLCGTPRAASVRTKEPCAVLYWKAAAFRNLLLREVFLSQRIFSNLLQSLVKKEKSLIQSLMERSGSSPSKE